MHDPRTGTVPRETGPPAKPQARHDGPAAKPSPTDNGRAAATPTAAPAGRKPLESRLRGVDTGIDEVEQLRTLYIVQAMRLEKVLALEDGGEGLEPSAVAAIDMARKLLLDLVKLKQEMGLLPDGRDGAQERFNPYEEAEKLGQPTLADALQQIPPARRSAVVRALEEALLGMPGGNGGGLPVVVEPGQCRP
jgi:hypothetical protein